MENYRDFLFSKAFQTVQGTEYNRLSSRMREENRDTLFSFYEVVLREEESWEEMKGRVYPALARFLKYKGFHPESGTGCVLALFFRGDFHLVHGPDFMEAFCQIEGLNASAFRSRVGEWLSQGPL